MRLYHFSEDPDIKIFEPRTLPNRDDERAKVWTIDEYHAPHYFFPRECPRVCFWSGDLTSCFLECPCRIELLQSNQVGMTVYVLDRFLNILFPQTNLSKMTQTQAITYLRNPLNMKR